MTPPSRLISATEDSTELLSTIRRWGQEMGFQAVGFTGVELSQHRDYLDKWLAAGYHGEMGWMASHGENEAALTHWFRVLAL